MDEVNQDFRRMLFRFFLTAIIAFVVLFFGFIPRGEDDGMKPDDGGKFDINNLTPAMVEKSTDRVSGFYCENMADAHEELARMIDNGTVKTPAQVVEMSIKLNDEARNKAFYQNQVYAGYSVGNMDVEFFSKYKDDPKRWSEYVRAQGEGYRARSKR